MKNIDTTKVFLDINGEVCLLDPKNPLQRVVQRAGWTAVDILKETLDGFQVIETYELHENIEALNKKLAELK